VGKRVTVTSRVVRLREGESASFELIGWQAIRSGEVT
jgi:hypothetical protein